MNIENGQIGESEKRRKEAFLKISEDFSLPSPSGTVMEVIRLCSSDNSSLSEVASLIETDPALSAEIIKYANSAFLSTGVQVASVQKAAVKLGMKTVVNLALGFSLLADNRTGVSELFDYPLFWRSSLAEALAAREIAKRSRDCDPDEIFICGLLSHIGKLSLATVFPVEYDRILAGQPLNSPLISDEFNTFGIDNTELTVELFLSWGMPAQYALAAGYHEDVGNFELGTGDTQRVAVLLYLADNIAKMCQSNEPMFELFETVIETSNTFTIDIGTFSETFQEIVDSWHQHGKLFDIQTKECYSYGDSEEFS